MRRILKHALEIPPMFDASAIRKLRKPELQHLLERLDGPMNERNNEERAAAIISILEGRRAEFKKQNKTATGTAVDRSTASVSFTHFCDDRRGKNNR
jgi:hypothetical protein